MGVFPLPRTCLQHQLNCIFTLHCEVSNLDNCGCSWRLMASRSLPGSTCCPWSACSPRSEGLCASQKPQREGAGWRQPHGGPRGMRAAAHHTQTHTTQATRPYTHTPVQQAHAAPLPQEAEGGSTAYECRAQTRGVTGTRASQVSALPLASCAQLPSERVPGRPEPQLRPLWNGDE